MIFSVQTLWSTQFSVIMIMLYTDWNYYRIVCVITESILIIIYHVLTAGPLSFNIYSIYNFYRKKKILIKWNLVIKNLVFKVTIDSNNCFGSFHSIFTFLYNSHPLMFWETHLVDCPIRNYDRELVTFRIG